MVCSIEFESGDGIIELVISGFGCCKSGIAEYCMHIYCRAEPLGCDGAEKYWRKQEML